MDNIRFRMILNASGLALMLALTGCTHESAATTVAPPPTVGIMRPVVREITDHSDFTGRTEAPYSVDIRARVTGYLVQMPFVEGTEVKTNDLLFEIDRRPFQAQLDRAQGEVVLNEARLKLAKADNARGKSIAKANAGAISVQDLDKYQAAEEEADAQVQASKANLESYQINLDFTKVISPIDGRVGRYNLTIGNLVNADTTLLTTVVSQNPMYTYFDVDEVTMLGIIRRFIAEKTDQIQAKTFPVFIGLADEDGYPHKGFLNFANNVVNSSTGTITIRGEFENKVASSGRRLLKPGMFVRVRLPIGKPYQALLVSEQAIGTDQGRKYLLVVDDKNIVQYRPVKPGPLQDDSLRVIASGLSADDRVIVSGLQLVRSKMEVHTEEVKPQASSAEEIHDAKPDSKTAPAPATKEAESPKDEQK